MPTVTIGENTGDTYTGCVDTYLDSSASTTNYATTDPLVINKYAVGAWNLALIKFTGLSNITGPVTVSNAYVSIFEADASELGNTVSIYRVLLPWVVGEATWNVYSGTDPGGPTWNTAGCLANGTDRITPASGAIIFTSAAYANSSDLSADVQNMINNPGSYPNYGWVFERTDGANEGWKWATYYSSEGTDTRKPKLTVTYTVGAPGTPLYLQGVI